MLQGLILIQDVFKFLIFAAVVGLVLWGVSKGTKRHRKPEEPVVLPGPEPEAEQEPEQEQEQEQEPEPVDALSQKCQELAEIKKAAQDAARYQPYAKLFGQLAQPLQLLLGVAAAPVGADSWLSEDFARDILEDDVVCEMKYAMRYMGATLSNGRISLPLQENEDAADLDAYLDKLDVAALDQKIRSAKLEKMANQVFLQRKALVEDLSSVYERLLELAQEKRFYADRVRDAATQAQAVLERNGVYPLFREAPELAGCENAWFEEVSETQLVYPGLFVRERGVLRQLGDHCGTWREC